MTTENPPHDATSASEPKADIDQAEDPVMLAFHDLVHEQAAYGMSHLRELHRIWLGPRGLFATLNVEIEQLGRQAPGLDDLQTLKCPEHLERAEGAVAFALAKSNRRVPAANPFRGLAREALCCIAFDETSGYTLVERYVAYEAMRQADSEFFIKLIATTRGVSERRIVFRGLLEHYDRLMPLEKCIFPDDYRSIQQAYLTQEEALNGPLQFDDDVGVLLEKMSPLQLLKRISATSDTSQ